MNDMFIAGIESMLKVHPDQTYVIINSNQLYTLTAQGDVVCFYGDFTGWKPESVEEFIRTNLIK